MKQKTRRQFLTDLGLSMGALTLVRGVLTAGSGDPGDDKKKGGATTGNPSLGKEALEFRYAPKNWQSTFCFPDDPHKSIVGKNNELFYGYTGTEKGTDLFTYLVLFGMSGTEKGDFIVQSFPDPEVPVIATTCEWKDLKVDFSTFATRSDSEGRVDNVIMEISGRGTTDLPASPEIIIKTKKQFSLENKQDSASGHGQIAVLTPEDEPGHPFLIVDGDVRIEKGDDLVRVKLPESSLSSARKVKYIIRFPQEQQPFEKIRDGMKDAKKLLQTAHSPWESWQPFDKKTSWNLASQYQPVLVASSRYISQCRTMNAEKPAYAVGPTGLNQTRIIDLHFIIESARYLGFDDASQKALQALWETQREDGTFPSVDGENNWKDIAVAVYALIRNAELTQNWDFFNESYPDAWKAMMHLQDLQRKGWDGPTINGKYGLLPPGYGDKSLDGVSNELTNTLWAMIAIKQLSQTADRHLLQKNVEVRQFYTDLVVNFSRMTKVEMIPHPYGFTYLPMLCKEDPRWKETDEQKRPEPQTAQIYLSQAIYPGTMFDKTNPVVNGHLQLMKAVMKEEVPAETGVMRSDAVCPLDAAVIANAFLWFGEYELARQIFIGFLNHASPLYAWHEEQSLLTAATAVCTGQMPQNRAAAECIRFLRHMLVLEDEKELLLLPGVGPVDLIPKKPFGLTSTPTRWGRVTLTMEPQPNKRWVTKYNREGFDSQKMPPLKQVVLPRALPGNVRLDSVKGAHFLKNGLRVEIDPEVTSWEALWIDYGK